MPVDGVKVVTPDCAFKRRSASTPLLNDAIVPAEPETVRGLAGLLVPIPSDSAEASQKNFAVVPVSS